MEVFISNYRQILKTELAKRLEKNPLYSMRAFAKSLSVNPGTLSSILNNKRFLSFKMGEQILENLNLDPVERKEFLRSIISEQKKRTLNKTDPNESYFNDTPTAELMDIEIFKIIGDWYHCAILELTYLSDFKAEPNWIAKKLGIGYLEAKLALERLISLGLLVKENGNYVKSNKQLETSDTHLTTPALRKLQGQFLEKAIEALENEPIESRYTGGMTMAIDPKKINVAKKLINEFIDRLSEVLETGEELEVYQFSASLFSLEKKLD